MFLSKQLEKVTLKIHGKELTYKENPVCFGVKLDKRWKPHLLNTNRKANMKLALMKKLAGTYYILRVPIVKT